VLVVEEDEASRAAIDSALRWNGYEVLGASSGTEAIELARHRRPHLVILGASLAPAEVASFRSTQLRNRALRPVAVIAYSAHDDVPLDADCVLGLPFDLLELLAAVALLADWARP
jgi:DNA-binding response OmpR family regulator